MSNLSISTPMTKRYLSKRRTNSAVEQEITAINFKFSTFGKTICTNNAPHGHCRFHRVVTFYHLWCASSGAL